MIFEVNNMKLKQSELKEYREKLLKEQNGICPLCGGEIESDPVLDHCHKYGHVRQVLHRICNTALGKAMMWVNRTPHPYDFHQNMFHYEHHIPWLHNPIHPKHKTNTEKEISRLRKRIKKLKTKKGKDRLKEQIKEMKKDVVQENKRTKD